MEHPNEIPRNLIDIERVIASKNPALLKVIPGFVIRYLKRITHQDAVNGYIFRNREKFGLEFVDAILQEFGAEVSVNSAICHSQEDSYSPFAICHSQEETNEKRKAKSEKPTANSEQQSSWISSTDSTRIADLVSQIIQSTGRYIIASNHPLGGLDGMALIQVAGRVRKDIVFPVNDLLMNVPGLRPLFIPINKHGKNTENVRIIEETFASDKVVLYFPAGLVSRKQRGGVIRDLAWKKTFITKARQHKRDVVPVYISGRNSDFFYNLANRRKRLGIKANLEMLFLVDEMVKQKDKPIRITFGEPIPYTTFDRSKTDSQWAKWVKEVVYSLDSQ